MPLARLKYSKDISFFPNNITGSVWEYNHLNAYGETSKPMSQRIYRTPSSPPPNNWRNTWIEDPTIEITCSCKFRCFRIINYSKNIGSLIITLIAEYDDNLLLPCKCNELVDSDGFGKCKKRDRYFDGKFSCYVDHPSSCKDLIENPKSSLKYLSAIACEDQNEGNCLN